ncbi:hypothetical protein [Pleomorphomonas carboxyditropha]|uniref:Transmembrane protein n=1 Tax=Pleomorphomonas carboxyditropha TaxID=2023338 RepID=A0A2G9WP18_9HYPH|nr:hypothetical protein [Pleomorphomonas carboxyditropha]PIO96446.1 hypothetical protein CJ014_25390 [Pleomorphomonas carboxyditropha]
MLKRLHPVAGGIALATISVFWLSTLLSEAFSPPATVTAVKTSIPWGFLLLIPALIAAGASGFRLSRGNRRGVVGAKARRMPFIAANGVVILVPAAIYLAVKAAAGEFDTGFYIVQAVELIAGLINIALLALSFRDGLRLTGRLRKRRA